MIRADRFLTDIREIAWASFITQEMLEAVALPDGVTLNPMSRAVVEGNTITIRYLSFLSGLPDADFPEIIRWSQLQLTSVSAEVQYKGTTVTTNIADFTASDIRYTGYTWHGEHANDAAAGNVSNVNTVYYRTSDNMFRGVSSNDAGVTTWANFAHNTGLLQPVSWLGSLSDDELTAYFQNNTYNSSRNYYFYEESSGQIRKYTQTTSESWTELTTGVEHDGVESDELTVDASQLKDRGILRITLIDDSISMDSLDFRIQITLND